MKRKSKYTTLQRIFIYLCIITIIISVVLSAHQVYVLFTRDTNQTTQKEKAGRDSKNQDTTTTSSYVLQETADAGKEYIDNTLFLGDSNTVRFMKYADDNGETYTFINNTIAVTGMGIDAITTLNCMQFSTGTFTMADAVSILQPRRIIMTFGTNNLTSDSSATARDAFIARYASQISIVQESYPYAEIIINSIPPLSETTSYINLSNEVIYEWNQAIEQMCIENEWYYLNSYEVLANTETHVANEGMMDGDGLHLSKSGIATLFNYIRTHALITEDRRPEINPIPTIYGPLTSLYETNPLTGETFTDDVLNPTDDTYIVPEIVEPVDNTDYSDPTQNTDTNASDYIDPVTPTTVPEETYEESSETTEDTTTP